ncbi:MAG: IS256 family transposase [Simkaniaceae bacterium]|nr:MAG: IS256 family transposase [Simkaniaceae bacterium]
MVSNQRFSPLIAEALEELNFKDMEGLCPTLQKLLNELMLIERERALKAAPYERTNERQGYANGFKEKTLQTRLGKLHLQIPQTREVPFYPTLLEKGQRSERALALAVAEMYVNGVSTRRVKRITEELCGLEISSTQVSNLSKILDEELEKFRTRPLGSMKYIYLDARYEKVREAGAVRSLAVLTALGVNLQGHREILSISCSLSEAEVHWRKFLENLLTRGLKGVQLIISDDHAGLKKARQAVLPGTPWQRCLFHMAQNAMHYAPSQHLRKEIAQSVRDIYQALNANEARSRMRQTVEKYQKKAPKFSLWLEENIEEGLSFFEFPRDHWKKIRTNNPSERLNQEFKRRTRVARLFPNVESCERLITAIGVEIHEEWVSGKRYMIMEDEV